MFDIAYLNEASLFVAEKEQKKAWDEFFKIPIGMTKEFLTSGFWFNRMYMAYLYWGIMYGTHGV